MQTLTESHDLHQSGVATFFITIEGLGPNVHYVLSYAFGHAVRFFSEPLYSSSEKKVKGHCDRGGRTLHETQQDSYTCRH